MKSEYNEICINFYDAAHDEKVLSLFDEETADSLYSAFTCIFDFVFQRLYLGVALSNKVQITHKDALILDTIPQHGDLLVLFGKTYDWYSLIGNILDSKMFLNVIDQLLESKGYIDAFAKNVAILTKVYDSNFSNNLKLTLISLMLEVPKEHLSYNGVQSMKGMNFITNYIENVLWTRINELLSDFDRNVEDENCYSYEDLNEPVDESLDSYRNDAFPPGPDGDEMFEEWLDDIDD